MEERSSAAHDQLPCGCGEKRKRERKKRTGWDVGAEEGAVAAGAAGLAGAGFGLTQALAQQGGSLLMQNLGTGVQSAAATQLLGLGASTSLAALQNTALMQNQRNMMCRIYVGSLDYYLTELEIKSVFQAFGTIVSVDMPKEGDRSKGFCFVEYASPEAAEMALSTMQNFVLKGRTIKVGRPTAVGTGGQQVQRTGMIMPGLLATNQTQVLTPDQQLMQQQQQVANNRVYIGNVPFGFSSEDLKKIFVVFGPILSCQLLPSQENPQQHRGYGFIEYATPEAAKLAIETMNGFEVAGKQLKVNFATAMRNSPAAAAASVVSPLAAAAAGYGLGLGNVAAAGLGISPLGVAGGGIASSQLNSAAGLNAVAGGTTAVAAGFGGLAATTAALGLGAIGQQQRPAATAAGVLPAASALATGGGAGLLNASSILGPVAAAPGGAGGGGGGTGNAPFSGGGASSPGAATAAAPGGGGGGGAASGSGAPPAAAAGGSGGSGKGGAAAWSQETTATASGAAATSSFSSEGGRGGVAVNGGASRERSSNGERDAAAAQKGGDGGDEEDLKPLPPAPTVIKSPVMMLVNMVAPDEVDSELKEEVREECSKFGAIKKVEVYPLEKDVRIFVHFSEVAGAAAAIPSLHGRWFGGRQIIANTYEERLFVEGEYTA